jgi:hypothetical protein
LRRIFQGTPWVARVALAASLAVAATLITATTAHAQVVKKAAAAPTELDMRPLARFVPGEKLILLAESEGLDAHADAWAKTAAYKLLNDTSLGTMLEAVGGQLVDWALANVPNRKFSGADVVAAAKHVAHKGFAFGLTAPSAGGAKPGFVVVFRGATAREFRLPFARLLGTAMGDSKPKLQSKGARSVVTVPGATPEGGWVWWDENHDLVIVPAGGDDIVAAVLDGQSPSAVDNPNRVGLAQPDGNFVPVGVLFVDPKAEGAAALGLNRLTDQGIERLDYRWGFSEDALMSVARLAAPGPRTGALAFFDQPGFEVAGIPPLPEGIESFTAVSTDPGKALGALLEAAPPDLRAQLQQSLDQFKTKSRFDLQTDVLSKVGPRMVAYLMPGSERTTPAPFSTLSGLGWIEESTIRALGGATIPRAVLVAEVKDPEEFGKALDVLMLHVNKELRAQAAEVAEAAEARAAANPAGGFPGGGGAERERRSTPPPSLEFRLSTSTPKARVYVMTVPSTMSRSFPSTLRPSIRLSGNVVVFGTAGDVARLAMDAQPGDWRPTAELATAFEHLPKEMLALNVTDPRPTMPEALAALPGNLQKGINFAISLSEMRSDGGGGTPPGGPAESGEGPGFGGPPGVGRGVLGGGAQPPGGSGGYPGGPPGGFPGGPPGGGNPSTAAAMLQLNIAPDALPKAEELRSLLFPSATAVSVDDREIKIVSRSAFPNLFSPGNSVGMALAMPAIQVAHARAAAAMGIDLAPAPAPAPGQGPDAPPGGPPPGYGGPQGGGARRGMP